MEWVDVPNDACSTWRTLQLIGDRWTMLVLRDLFNGVRRFDDFQRHLGVARDVLTRRLSGLVDAGLVSREPYREQGQRARHEYRLTKAGKDLRPVLVALMEWGDRWLPAEAGPALVLSHQDCGEPVGVKIVCRAGHDAGRELVMHPGPGARAAGSAGPEPAVDAVS